MPKKLSFLRNLSNLPGWRSPRKIIILESDDWGSIRMPSNKVYNSLKSNGLDLDSFDSYRYNQYDTLASSHDLSMLFEILSGFKDRNGNNPVMTVVSLVANPDFEKIKSSDFHEYSYEAFPDTLKKYGIEDAYNLWREGYERRLFVPQFHGREHLNVAAWMRALQSRDKETMLAFDCNMWGFNNKYPPGLSYQAAFDLEHADDLNIQEEIIIDGLKIFRQLHGYSAEYFVPPNGPINNSLEKTAAMNGIQFMMGSKIQHEALGYGRTRRVFHWPGQKNKQGQRYLTRNCFFEPSDKSKNWVDICLSEINIAFKWNKPAIISSHRVNYVGTLDPANRDNGLRQLKELLIRIVNNWPQVEFLTSSQLGKIIKEASK